MVVKVLFALSSLFCVGLSSVFLPLRSGDSGAHDCTAEVVLTRSCGGCGLDSKTVNRIQLCKAAGAYSYMRISCALGTLNRRLAKYVYVRATQRAGSTGLAYDALMDALLPWPLRFAHTNAGSFNQWRAMFHILVLYQCFGKNDKGQLGLDDTENRGDGATEMGSSLPDVSLGVNRTAVDVMADGDRTCALLDTLDVRCWGDGEFGALGNGAEDNTGDGAVEVDATVDIGGSSVSALCEGPCVIVDDGSVKVSALHVRCTRHLPQE